VDGLDDPIGVVRREDVFAEHVGFRRALAPAGRARARQRSPLKWGSSVAGYLFAGESYVAAATRRLREEIGLETPLQKLGATRMQDEGAMKFIELFVTTAEVARIEEPDHIEALEFVSLVSIDDRLRADPEAFTETFPVVYRLFRAVVG
jgi:isopentenyl-diphosphate Delta-isomerase